MAHTPPMRTLMLAILALVPCAGCVVEVHEDGTSPPPTAAPAPADGPTVVVVEGGSEAFMLKYTKDVPEVYEGFKKACVRLNIKISDTHQPGSGNNWTASGFHSSGTFDVQIGLYRRDHKSQTTLTVKSGRFSEQQCREWARRIHAEIGKQLGEDGRN
jgi:hypothetical protein